MAKTTKPAARPKRSKAEIDEEFAEIREEVATAREMLEPKAEELRKQKKGSPAVGRGTDCRRGRGRHPPKWASKLSNRLAVLRRRTWSVNERLVSSRGPVTLEQKELERLHKIDVAAHRHRRGFV